MTSRNAVNPLLSKWAEHDVKASIIDVPTASHEELVKMLQGVDIVVSFIGAGAFESQKPLFKAAKDAGVGRVVPSDFGPACPPGIMRIQDIVSRSRYGYLAVCADWFDAEIGYP